MNSESSKTIIVFVFDTFVFGIELFVLVAIVSSGKFWGASCIVWHQINERTYKKWARNIHTSYNDAQNVFSYIDASLVFGFSISTPLYWFNCLYQRLTEATMKSKPESVSCSLVDVVYRPSKKT